MLEKIRKLLFYLIVFFIPFNIKKFLFYFNTPFEIPINYNATFLYFFDVLVLFFLILSVKDFKNFFSFSKFFYIFLGLVFIFGFFALNFSIFLYSFFRFFLFALFGGAVAYYLSQNAISLQKTFLVLGFSGFLQTIISVLQFRNQSSIGLKILGESVLGPETSGVARVYTPFGNLLRVYGTMPHANILATFLVIAFLSFIYLFLKKKNIYYLIPASTLVIGIILTFSRSGFFIFFLGILATFFILFLNRNFKKEIFIFAVFLIILFLILFLEFKDLIFARFYVSFNEPSFVHRAYYNLIGIELFKKYPILGVGFGNQILAGLKNGLYSAQNLNFSWQWQPIHNIYLLVLVETGVISFLIFLFFFFSIFLKSIKLLKKNLFSNKFLDFYFTFLILLLMLIIGIIDHFPLKLESGMLLFFLFLGLVVGELNRENKNI